MNTPQKRPYFDPSVLRAKREQREQQHAPLVAALKAALGFGRALIVMNDGRKIETPNRKP